MSGVISPNPKIKNEFFSVLFLLSHTSVGEDRGEGPFRLWCALTITLIPLLEGERRQNAKVQKVTVGESGRSDFNMS